MNIEIINKLDEIIGLIKSDKDYIRMNQLNNIIMSNKQLIEKINILKTLNTYDEKYLEMKKEIIDNSEFKEYKELEKDYYFFIKEINSRLNTLKETSGCK